ncbi:biopolymer transporter ExbD [Mucilaginibacter sp.]|uniref:ExbD/TolR family protein n=1 Tax=Mucilaginibacter sp. TaxID=1882438 RepID=UPI00284F0E66|nr:biopolymer transporter ExbD [Mucilaginibacter sp.]MDR3694315.1 biopolymer transporter ExbD [Mucilaginibacter sp.]
MNLRKRQRGVSAEVHTSAMNDIMFFLLLFFLIAATLTNPNVIKLLLPKSSSGKPISKKTLNVTISKELQYTVDNKPIAIADLPAALSSYKNISPDLTIILHVDKTVAIQDIVEVMDISNKLNIKLVLATIPK